MFNLKWGLICSLTAFALAFLMSLFAGHTPLTVALLRGLIFAVLFFILGTGAWMLINSFIPEVLSPEHGNDPAFSIFSGEPPAGSRVNITLGDQSEATLPGKDGKPHDLDEVEDINDLVSGNLKRTARRIDQTPANSYNDESGEFAPVLENYMAAQGGEGDFSVDFGSLITGGDSEPEEFQPLSDSFPHFSSGEGDSAPEGPSKPERKAARNKPEKFEGDFDAKEIAAGLRTVLQKDK
ncbi:MAG: hypothetical protein LBQ69_05105 [Treponema sp.]|jgi:hypothetical protein|nr:hypothetical protein [Treponema sp.]